MSCHRFYEKNVRTKIKSNKSKKERGRERERKVEWGHSKQSDSKVKVIQELPETLQESQRMIHGHDTV